MLHQVSTLEPIQESRPARKTGHLIVGVMTASLSDVNDLTTLSCNDSHHGAQKILRSLFERIVT